MKHPFCDNSIHDKAARGAMVLLTLATALVASAGASYAKLPPVVQYANISPLPGGGTALNEEGKADGLGAMQINIPVAYTPGDGYANLGVFAGNYIKGQGHGTNGSAVAGMGFGGWPRVYFSGMAVSSVFWHESKALNGQLQVTKETESMPALAVGAQDIRDKEESFKDVAVTGPGYYGVATKHLKLGTQDVFAVAGYGAGKFRHNSFGGLSTPISDKFTFAAEYDGYQFNTGVAWRPTGRDSHLTVLAAYNGKAGPLFGAQATGKVSYWWAPVLLALAIRH